MNVNRIQKDYSIQNKTVNRQASVSFQKGGKSSLGDRIIDSLHDSKTIKKMKKAEFLKGEFGGIALTAFGTGFVAPWPIAFNPMVKAPKGATEEEKEDLEKTKKYTAMRQIVSMVLSAVFQLGALKPIDMFLDNIFNKQEYAKHFGLHYNLSEINNKSYVEKLAKEALKSKKGSLSKEEYKIAFDAKVKEIEKEQIDKVAKNFLESGKIQIGKEFLDNKTMAELINSQIDCYIDDAKKLRFDHDKMAFYSQRAETLMNNEEYLKQIFNNLPTEPKQLQKKLEELFAKEKNADVKELIKEILDRPQELHHSRIERTLSRIEYIKKVCKPKGGYSKETYLESMSLRNGHLDGIITNLKLLKSSDTKLATDESIRETISKLIKACTFDKENSDLKTILHDTDTFDFKTENLKSKIHKDITKQYKELLKNKYKGLNQLIKIAVGVCITLPITCNILNWVYPRFMRIAFPNLAGVKKEPTCSTKIDTTKIKEEEDD